METKPPHWSPGDPIDADTLMNIVSDNQRHSDAWQSEGCGDDSRDGYKMAMKQFQLALDTVRKSALKEMYEALTAEPRTVEAQMEKGRKITELKKEFNQQ